MIGGISGNGAYGGSPTKVSTSSALGTQVSSAGPTCPYLDGQRYVDALGQIYMIECDQALDGTTISTLNTTDLSGCIAACTTYNMMQFYAPSSCLGVSFLSSSNADNCQLRAGYALSVQTSVYSAILITPSDEGNGTEGGGSALTTKVETTFMSSTVYGVSTAISTFISNGQTILSTHEVSTAISVSYQSVTVAITVTGSGGTGAGTNPGTGPGTGTGTGAGTGPGSTSYVPSTVFGVSTAVSTYVSKGITVISTYGVMTEVTVSYLPASTQTVTTTTVSTTVSTAVSTTISVSTAVSTVPSTVISTVISGQTVVTTAPGQTVVSVSTVGGRSGGGSGDGETVTVTAGGGGTVVVTQVITVSPSSTPTSFTCRTYYTNYLNAAHGKKVKKRSVFDTEVGLTEEEKVAKPGARMILNGW